jgi:hypothetical protein
VENLLQAQNVTSVDNWNILQTRFHRCDVWDIIYYNFATYNPEEVNWYLQEWIGCTDATPDGQNYRFGARADGRPMTIYIPVADWVPPGPRQVEARQAALAVLAEPVTLNLHFKAGALELRAGDMLAVANAITDGRITVIHRPCLGWMAQYRGGVGFNQLLVPFASAPPAGMKALMVHEAVHAAMDVARIPQTMQQAEALAYIAQALYSRRNGGNLGAAVPQPAFAVAPLNFVAWSGIFKKAGSIADDIDTGQPVSNLDLITLALSITIAPSYQNEGAPPNDGV